METVILVAWGAAMFVMAGALVYILIDNTKLHRLIDKVRRDGVANKHQADILDIHIERVHRRIKELDEKIEGQADMAVRLLPRISKVEGAVRYHCKHQWKPAKKSGFVEAEVMNHATGRKMICFECEICGAGKFFYEKEARKLTAAYHKRKATEAEKE